MSLRSLLLATFARDPQRLELERRWRTARVVPRVLARVVALESCAGDLLVRLRELRLGAAVPDVSLEALAMAARLEAAQMLRMRAQLAELLAAFRAAKLEVTLLKGAAFLQLGMRPHRWCSDLDLLFSDDDVPRAWATLARLGYESAESSLPATHRHLPPLHREGLAVIEVHRRPIDATPLAGDWSRRELTPGVSILSPTDWCWHALAHEADLPFFSRIRSALDVAALMERYGAEIDWDVIGVRAAQWPFPIEPLLHDLHRLGYDARFDVSRRTRLLAAGLDMVRESVARATGSEWVFYGLAHRLGRIARRAGGSRATPLLGAFAPWVAAPTFVQSCVFQAFGE
jgi:hypothetical protein